VPDASRSVTVVSNLLSDDARDPYIATVREEYETIRKRNAGRDTRRNMITFEQANANALQIDWQNYQPPRPAILGSQVLDDYPLAELVPYIDWTPFFITWSLSGKYPAIFEDEVVGEAARDLFADAQEMLHKLIDERLLRAQAVYGFWRAARTGINDVTLYADDECKQALTTFNFLRQQSRKSDEQPNLSLADFVAPIDGPADYMGGFAVSTGSGADALAERYAAENNDYNSLMVKALADRLAEAFAEHLHQRVRREFWGYVPDETLSNEALIRERYQGIRPAPGYPACPEHSDKVRLFELLEVTPRIELELTESYAMWPASSVSGFYFSHPQAKYFSVGKIDEDQLLDFARRRGVDRAAAQKMLQPVLA